MLKVYQFIEFKRFFKIVASDSMSTQFYIYKPGEWINLNDNTSLTDKEYEQLFDIMKNASKYMVEDNLYQIIRGNK